MDRLSTKFTMASMHASDGATNKGLLEDPNEDSDCEIEQDVVTLLGGDIDEQHPDDDNGTEQSAVNESS